MASRTPAERADDEIALYEEAAAAYRGAVYAESEHEAQRAKMKQEAIVRLVEQEHPATPGKRYSYTAAESAAATDTAYANYLALGRHLTDERIKAETHLEACRLCARLAIAVVGVGA